MNEKKISLWLAILVGIFSGLVAAYFIICSYVVLGICLALSTTAMNGGIVAIIICSIPISAMAILFRGLWIAVFCVDEKDNNKQCNDSEFNIVYD
jgi:hypothetical protein